MNILACIPWCTQVSILLAQSLRGGIARSQVSRCSAPTHTAKQFPKSMLSVYLPLCMAYELCWLSLLAHTSFGDFDLSHSDEGTVITCFSFDLWMLAIWISFSLQCQFKPFLIFLQLPKSLFPFSPLSPYSVILFLLSIRYPSIQQVNKYIAVYSVPKTLPSNKKKTPQNWLLNTYSINKMQTHYAKQKRPQAK